MFRPWHAVCKSRDAGRRRIADVPPRCYAPRRAFDVRAAGATVVGVRCANRGMLPGKRPGPTRCQAPPDPVPSPTWPGASPHLIRTPPIPFGAPRRPSLPLRPEHVRKPFESIPVLATLCSPIRAVCGTITFAPKCRFRHARYQGYKYYGTSGGAAQCRLKTSCARTTATARSSS